VGAGSGWFLPSGTLTCGTVGRSGRSSPGMVALSRACWGESGFGSGVVLGGVLPGAAAGGVLR
jgi:hypothetical protein